MHLLTVTGNQWEAMSRVQSPSSTPFNLFKINNLHQYSTQKRCYDQFYVFSHLDLALI